MDDKGILKDKFANHEVKLDSLDLKKRMFEEFDARDERRPIWYIWGKRFSSILVLSGMAVLLFSYLNKPDKIRDTSSTSVEVTSDVKNLVDMSAKEAIVVEGDLIPLNSEKGISLSATNKVTEPTKTKSPSVQKDNIAVGKTEIESLNNSLYNKTSSLIEKESSINPAIFRQTEEVVGQQQFANFETLSPEEEDNISRPSIIDRMGLLELKRNDIKYSTFPNLPTDRIRIARESKFSAGLIFQILQGGTVRGRTSGTNINQLAETRIRYTQKAHYKVGLAFQYKLSQRFFLEQNFTFGSELSTYSIEGRRTVTESEIIQEVGQEITQISTITTNSTLSFRQDDLSISFTPKLGYRFKLKNYPRLKIALVAGPVFFYDLSDEIIEVIDEGLQFTKEDARLTYGYEISTRLEFNIRNNFSLFSGVALSARGSRRHKIRDDIVIPVGIEFGFFKRF